MKKIKISKFSKWLFFDKKFESEPESFQRGYYYAKKELLDLLEKESNEKRLKQEEKIINKLTIWQSIVNEHKEEK